MPTTVTDRQLSGGDWAVYLSEQTAQGSINASPVWHPERRTEGRIKSVPSYTTSAEVSLDFNPSQQVQDGRESTGEISFELTKQKISRLFAAIYGAETQVTENSTTIAATVSGFTSTDGSFANIEVGDYPYFSGLAAAANNKGYRVTAKADDDTITTYPAPPVVAAAGVTIAPTT